MDMVTMFGCYFQIAQAIRENCMKTFLMFGLLKKWGRGMEIEVVRDEDEERK